MAIDVNKKADHIVMFPSFVASAMGQYGHIINLVMQANQDNGVLAAKGDYVSFEQYKMAAVADNKVEGVIREASAEGGWYVEFTKLDGQYFLVYNSPISPYPEKELRDEALFYNAKGDVTQGMELHLGDVISLSDDAFTGTAQAGKTVKYSAGKYIVQ
jgi:hypothetical protein